MNYFNDPKYFRTEIVLCRLCKLLFYLPDSHVLPDTKRGLRDSNTLPFGLHPTPYGEDVIIRHWRRCHASDRVYRVIVNIDKLRQNVYISVCVFECEILGILSRIFL